MMWAATARAPRGPKYYVLPGGTNKNGPTTEVVEPSIGTAGFEPATPATPLQCATGLRHVPKGRKVYAGRGTLNSRRREAP